jgi:two-component system, response regulator YesN
MIQIKSCKLGKVFFVCNKLIGVISGMILFRNMFNKMKESYFGHIMLSFSILIVLTIFILSSVLYINFIEISKRLIYDGTRANLEQTSVSIKFLSEYVEGVASQVTSDKAIMRLVSNSFQDPIQLNDSLNRLNNIRYSSPMVQSIYVYNKELSNFYVTAAEANSLFPSKVFFDQEILDYISRLHEYKRMSPIPRRIQMTSPNGVAQIHDVYTYIYYDSFVTSGNVDNIVIMNISSRWLFNAFQYMEQRGDSDNNTFIIDSKGRVVFSSDAKEITADLSKEPYIENILNRKDPSGYFINDADGSSVLVTFVKSDYYDWYFVSVTPYHLITDRFARMRHVTLLISLLILASGITGSLVLSTQLHKPVKLMFSKLSKLEKEKLAQMADLKNKLLITLLNNNPHENNPEIGDEFYALQNLKINLQAPIVLLLFHIDNFNAFCNSDLYANRKSLKAKVTESAEKIFTPALSYELIDLDNDKLVFIANFHSESNSEFYTKHHLLIKSMRDKLEEQINVSFTICISSLGHTYRDLPFIFAEAIKNSGFRFALGHKSIIFPKDISNAEVNVINYQLQREKALTEAIMLEKEEAACDIYRQYVSAIGIVPKEIYHHILNHIFFIIKSAFQNKLDDNNVLSNRFSDFFKLLQQCETLNEANTLFEFLLHDIFSYLQDSKKTKYDELVNNIITFIDNNYHSNTLSINCIADEVDMSAAYLGKLFKQITSKSITDYICDVRLSKAKELIVNSELSVNEISELCGFTNSSYFYMVFKKNCGITPNQFRQSFRKGNPVVS